MLFNSLNTLQSLIRETPARAVDYTQELSRVLRYTLQSNESRFVTLAEELAFAEAYIFLMKMRYEENLSFDVAVDKQLRDRLLPPMSLQVLDVYKRQICTHPRGAVRSRKVSDPRNSCP